MSRYSVKNIYIDDFVYDEIKENCFERVYNKFPKKGLFQIVYGFDHACGYFIQFFPEDEIAKINAARINYCSDLDGGYIDIDSLFDGLSGSQLGFMLKLFNANEDHVELAYLDLPL